MVANIGIAHVAGKYPIEANFLTDGIAKIKALGTKAKTVKIYLSPGYVADYPNQTWGATYSTLAGLAADAAYQTVLGDAQITRYFINTWTFANGLNNPWTVGISPTMLANETAEIQALATYLFTTYRGTGKTFVLQNWEGDWSLLGSFINTDYIPPNRCQWMQAFLAARQKGIEAAKKATGANDVKVLFGVEINRALDPGLRVHKDILPYLKPDMISLSAYEATNAYIPFTTMAAAKTAIDTALRNVVALVRAYNGDSVPIYIGEYGWPEAETAGGFLVGQAIQQVIDTSNALGLTDVLYWNVWDNASPYRGFAIYDQTQTLTAAGVKHQALFT